MDAGRLGKIETWLCQESKADSVTLTGARLMSGGAIQQNWAISADFSGGNLDGHHELVLRTDPYAPLSVGLDRATEFAVLKAAKSAGVACPESLYADGTGRLFDTPFLIMRRCPGTASPDFIANSSELDDTRHLIAEALGRELAKIHTIQLGESQLKELPTKALSPAIQRIDEFRVALDSLPNSHPVAEWGVRWLELNAPPTTHRVLTHGDFRTGNYLVHEGTLSAVLDWEFAGWSDPLEDIGWFTARCWRYGHDENEAGGIAPGETFLAAYEEAGGGPVDRERIGYWQVLATVRWAIIALSQGMRHSDVADGSLELLLTGRKGAELEHEILRLITEVEGENPYV